MGFFFTREEKNEEKKVTKDIGIMNKETPIIKLILIINEIQKTPQRISHDSLPRV